MILGIDAHCIRGTGGSLTHLRELLRSAEPEAAGFERVVIWSGSATLDQIEDRPWLQKMHASALDGGLGRRSYWSAVRLSAFARRAGCAVLWAPGCSFAGSFRPYVAMSRNMLPFEWRELRRYAGTARFAKFLLLRRSQGRSFRRSDGMIFLTEYARGVVMRAIGTTRGSTCVIPHGIDRRFFLQPRAAREQQRRVRLLYVSPIDLYKHQWHVIAAVDQLRRNGYDVDLELAGSMYPPAEGRLRAALARYPMAATVTTCLGHVPYAELPRRYADADVFVFASSCENLPNILLEAMAAGLPIASSDRGPMPEVLRDAGLYFDPEDPGTIAAAVRRFLDSPALRGEKAALAGHHASAYSWSRCARETLSYLARVANEFHTSTSDAGRFRNRSRPSSR